jgi:hypothetical protein
MVVAIFESQAESKSKKRRFQGKLFLNMQQQQDRNCRIRWGSHADCNKSQLLQLMNDHYVNNVNNHIFFMCFGSFCRLDVTCFFFYLCCEHLMINNEK